MATRIKPQTLPAVMEHKIFQGLREIAVLAGFASALFLLIALITFNHEDGGWSHPSTTDTVHNAGGAVGAWFADIALNFFGIVAYSFPAIVIWQGYLFHRQIRFPIEKSLLIVLGLCSVVIAIPALLHLHAVRVGLELPGSAAGILGDEVGEKTFILFGSLGASLFLLALLLAGITLATGLSWLALLDFLGKHVCTGCHFVFRRAIALGEKNQHPVAAECAQASIPVKAKTAKAQRPTPSGSEQVVSALVSPLAAFPKAQEAPKVTVLVKKEASALLPPLDLLDKRENRVMGYSQDDLAAMADKVEQILADFNVSVKVIGFYPGPVITRFELAPAAGVKASRISTLSKDLARALLVTSVRIVEVIPGKSVVGLEIPNRERETVSLGELLASNSFAHAKSLLTLSMGKDISGVPIVADLAKMPHALVAGTTGSGKSVAINTMILSLLYRASPEQVRLILIDPKMLELSVYEGIPHLLTPVVTDMKKASNALRWAVAEMERRYKMMSKMGVRNLAGFNQLINEATARGETIKDPMVQVDGAFSKMEEVPDLALLPSIVIVIDELADMMMVVGKKVEELIARLAQKARAAGIHLVLATQRPSVDVLTGLIKANIPTRISFQVSSRIDSRTVLDQGGAENLLGNGDMLFLPSGTSLPIRAHGAFVDDHEVHRVVEFLKQTAPPDYLPEITQEMADPIDNFATGGGNGNASEIDPLYDEAVKFVADSRKASISSVQRRFKIGYNRAASIIESMEAAGVVSAAESNGSRTVLTPPPPRA